MQIDVSRFRAAFYVEAAEHLQHMEGALLQLESAPRDTELLNTIFRAAHSIKGASTTFGIDEVGRFTHVLENLLERLRDGVVDTSSELVELLLTSVDVIDGLIANAKDGAPMPSNLEQVFGELQRVNGQPSNGPKQTTEPPVAAVATSTKYRIQLKPSREFFRFGQDPLLLLRELSELGTVHKIDVDERSLPSLCDLQAEDCYLAWTIELETQSTAQSLSDVFMFLDDGSSFQVEAIGTETTAATATETQIKPEANTEPASPAIVEEKRSGNERRSAAAAPAAKGAENETVRVDRVRLTS